MKAPAVIMVPKTVGLLMMVPVLESSVSSTCCAENHPTAVPAPRPATYMASVRIPGTVEPASVTSASSEIRIGKRHKVATFTRRGFEPRRTMISSANAGGRKEPRLLIRRHIPSSEPKRPSSLQRPRGSSVQPCDCTLVIRQGGEQFRNRLARRGMTPIRRDLGKRHEHERPVLQTRMRNFRRSRFDPGMIVDQIDIERSWRVLLVPFAAETILDPMQERHKFPWRKFRLDARDRVDKRRIGRIRPCLCDVIR